jgi:hypothetical protein
MKRYKSLSLAAALIVSLLVVTVSTVQSQVGQDLIPDWTSIDYAPFNLVEPTSITNPVFTANDVTDVPARFVADPFLFYEYQNDKWYMFFEVLDDNTGVGEIGLATSTDGLNWQYDQIVLSENDHLSYPFVFKFNGEYYMSPETFWANEVRLYQATNFPYNWVHVYTLARGRDFSDRAIFRHNNIWWMFVGNTGHRDCYLYYSDSLTSGWIEHPMSPIVSNDKSKARPGGRSFVLTNDRIIRIAQKDDVVYGEQVRAFEVDILTKTDYAEHEVQESPILQPSGIGWNEKGMHHFDPWWNGDHWLCAVDGQSGDGTWAIGLYITPDPSMNSPPRAGDDSATTTEDTSVSIDVLGNDSDVDGNLVPSTVTVINNPSRHVHIYGAG